MFVAVAGGILAVYAVFVGALLVVGRRRDASALARFVPDCLVLFRRLAADPRVSRRRKLALLALIGYLAMPFDLVPDFIPVVGQLDDAILVALILRWFLRGTSSAVLREHWPGPTTSLDALLRVAGSGGPDARARPRG